MTLTIGKITYSPDYGKFLIQRCDHKHAKRIGKSSLIWCRDCQRTVRKNEQNEQHKRR